MTLPRHLPPRVLAVPILAYHRVGPPTHRSPLTDALTVPTARFAAEMRWLRRAGFHAITERRLFEALEYGAPLPRRPVAITFDDGYRDVLWNAVPVLARLHMPATMYVVTGRVSGPDPSFLTWGELRLLERRGIAVGSHTVDHVELPGLGAAAALRELVASRRALERHLGHPVQWLSYPAGRFDAAVEALVARAGYALAVTMRPGVLQEARSPFALRRLEVLGATDLPALLGG